MDYSEEQIEKACASVMRKASFEDKLQEAAEMFLALETGHDLSDFKRSAARLLLESAIRSTGNNKSKGARKIRIHRNSVERILHGDPLA